MIELFATTKGITKLIRSQTPRFSMYMLFGAIAAQAANTAIAKKLDGDRLLAPEHLVEIKIELPADDWQQLRRQSRNSGAAFSGIREVDPFSYFKANIWIDGTRIDSVGVRKKGFLGSADTQRPSLKIKFDEYEDQDPIRGLSRLTLNNNKQDRSQLSQYLTYRLFRRAGHPAPRCNWARVTVNGISLGIYSNVESIKKPFLKRVFDDKSGNLYEGTLTDFHTKALSNIEVKTNEDGNDLEDISRLAELLAEEGELDLEELDRILDVDAFFRFWALEGLTGFWDGYSANQNNYYLYFNPADGRGQFIPWGADWVFTDGGPFSRGGFGGRGRSTSVIYAQGIIANRLYKTAAGPARYRSTLRQILDDVWDEDTMLAEIDQFEELVAPHLHEAQAGTPQALDQLRSFIQGRRAVVKQALEDWRPSIPAEPRKPAYVVEVGKASGSFSTSLSEDEPDESSDGEANIVVELDGEVLEFESQFVRVQNLSSRGFGGFGGRSGFGPRPGGFGGISEQPPAQLLLVISGQRSSGRTIHVSFSIDKTLFKASSDAIRVTGNFRESSGGNGFGRGGFGFAGFGAGPSRSVIAELKLSEAGTELGDAVAGRLDLKIVESHGGFFQQRQGGGFGGRGGFGGPGAFGGNDGRDRLNRGRGFQRPSSGPQQADSPLSNDAPGNDSNPPALRGAHDRDGAGTISSVEIANANSRFKQLDQDGDGKLTSQELLESSTTRATDGQRNRSDRPPSPEPLPQQKDLKQVDTPTPVVMSTRQDHQNMLSQLGITRLRPGPSGNPDAPNSANYDEAKANPYPELPDVLTLKNGETITTAERWWADRRAEIIDDFEREVVGRIPDGVPKVKWELLKTIEKELGETTVIEKRLVGRVDNSDCPEIAVNIMMSVVTPKAAEKPVPALMMFGFTSFGPDGEDLDFGGRFGGFGRREGGPPPKTEQLVKSGWGYATINANSIQEDSGGERQRRFGPPRPEGQTGGGLTRGIIGLTNKGQPRKPDQWGSLRAWAWGASRGLDYLESDPSIDSKKVGIEGVSRYGKAALVTHAFDQRFAAGLIGSSGEGGASLYRRNFGEAVENLTGSGEYHWMAGNFLKYGTAESSFGEKNASDLPVDAHMLIALCAPRPTFISYGIPEKGDALWLDQPGSFMATVAAQPVFRLLGAADLGRGDDYMKEPMPQVNEGLLDGDLAWRQHDGGHTDTPNIAHFIQWAESRFDRDSNP